MELKHLEGVCDDKLLGELRDAEAQFHVLKGELKNQAVSPEHEAKVLQAARDTIIEKFETRRREELANTESELNAIKDEYVRKIESQSQAAKRTQELSLRYGPMTNAELDDLAHQYYTGSVDISDRLELLHVVGELEKRGSPKLDEFRKAIGMNNGMKPWERLAPDLPARKKALESAAWGEFPVRIKNKEGVASYMTLAVADYFK